MTTNHNQNRDRNASELDARLDYFLTELGRFPTYEDVTHIHDYRAAVARARRNRKASV